MKYRFFAIPARGAENEQVELNRFCDGHKVISLEKEFVADGQQSFWSICVCYLPASDKASVPMGKVDYREVLNDQDFAVFAKLRTLRKDVANENGIPAYAVFTNEQLAAMVQKRILSLSAMA